MISEFVKGTGVHRSPLRYEHNMCTGGKLKRQMFLDGNTSDLLSSQIQESTVTMRGNTAAKCCAFLSRMHSVGSEAKAFAGRDADLCRCSSPSMLCLWSLLPPVFCSWWCSPELHCASFSIPHEMPVSSSATNAALESSAAMRLYDFPPNELRFTVSKLVYFCRFSPDLLYPFFHAWCV